MKLINPSEKVLNEAFATEVAGWVRGHDFSWAKKGERGFFGNTADYFRFTQSADEVLPYLEKAGFWTCQHSEHSGDYTVSDDHMDANGTNASDAETFPRAAVIMLLRSKGVEVEFTK